jgi:hypothetical protein
LTITAMLAIAVAVPAATGSWSASASWGPREIVPLLPLLVLPVGEIVEAGFNATARRARFVLFGVTSLTAIFGIAVTTLGIVVPYDRYGAEYTASPSAFHRAVIDPDDAPLRVHVERFADDIDTPDLAARRYDANWLWYAAVALAWFGLLCLVVVVLRTLRPPLEPVPPLRLPPPGWDAEPRC